MTNTHPFTLTFFVLYPSRENIEKALTFFQNWCHKQPGSPKKYGLVITGSNDAEFFISSHSQIDNESFLELSTKLEDSFQVIVLKEKPR